MSEISQIKKLLLLSFVFTVGCVLVVLSCTLHHNWLPLKSLLMFSLVPLSHSFAGRSRTNDIMGDSSETAADFARFFTSILLFSAYALPLTFAHNGLITWNAMVTSTIGGSLICGSLLTFGAIFPTEEEY